MKSPPDFDPYLLLGVDAHSDAITIDRAYKMRIRAVHPDVAGPSGLEETKRLNVAREWLLDPELRAQLPRPSAPAWEPGPREPWPSAAAEQATAEPHPSWAWSTDRPRHTAPGSYDPLEDDPLTFDYGDRAQVLRDFFETIRSLSDDERARVSYSLGEEAPVAFEGLERHLDEVLLGRSRALADAIVRVWNEREDEGPYFVLPRGILFGEGPAVANAYAQWLLLGDVLARWAADTEGMADLAERSTWPWAASLGHDRYGTYGREITGFLADAAGLSARQAERLARSWQGHMGRFIYGRPGDDWFPGALESARPVLVGARVATVDASRIPPPEGLLYEHHNAHRYGLRLTAHVLALGGVSDSRADFLRPWKDALDRTPSFADRARWGMPTG